MSNSTPCAYQYTVKRGDSFYLIAHRVGVPLRDLLAANPGIPPSRLAIGDVLCIPYTSDVQTPATECPPATGNGATGGDTSNGETPPVETPPVETPPVETPPVETPPVETPPVETPELCPPTRRTVVQNDQTAADLQLRYGLSYYTLQTANSDVDLETIAGGDVVCVPTQNIACPLPVTVELAQGQTLDSLAVAYNLPIAAILRANPCLAPEDFVAGVTIRLPN